jgi:2-polyprenyl-3-methyl-5-hydroxy-6-metoxy-1,4-benzoquinol methylase
MEKEGKSQGKRHLFDKGAVDHQEGSKKPKQDPKQQKVFRYGNYNRYYGYRNANKEKDKRIDVFKEEWFHKKKCLDIGCNVGHLTLWIAKYFQVKSMKGIDIDCKLIQAAKNNIIHYIDDEVKSIDSNSKANCADLLKEGFPYNITFVTVSRFYCFFL